MRNSRVVLVLLAVFSVTFGCDRERPAAAPAADTMPPPALPETAVVTPDTLMARDTASGIP